MEVLYLRGDLHTGHLQEASHELVETTLQVARKLEGLVEEVEKLDPEINSQGLINGLIRPTSLPDQIHQRWNHREAWVGRFLHTARVINTPELVDRRVSTLLQQALPPENSNGLENFLFATRERLGYLGSERALMYLGSLKLGAFAYTESRVLRRAIYEGIYFTPAPQIPNLN